MLSRYEYQVVEDTGGGLTLYVFGDGGSASGEVIYAHTGYEYILGQLSIDLDHLDSGGEVSIWDGCEDDPQGLYDDLIEYERGWQIVVQGADGERTLYPRRMVWAAKLEFGVVDA